MHTLLLILFVLILSDSLESQEKGLVFGLTTNKDKFVQGETVFLKLSVYNPTDTLHFFSTSRLVNRIKVLDQLGNNHFRAISSSCGQLHFLLPGDSLGFLYKQDPDWRKDDIAISRYDSETDRLGPGTYRAQFTSRLKDELVVYATSSEFEIQPAGKSERQAYKEFMHIWNFYLPRNDCIERDQLIFAIEAFLKEYPGSIYASSALRRWPVWGYRDQLNIARRLIAEFPDYYAIGEKILYVERELRSRKDKEGFARFLRELLLKHPGTRTSEEAEIKLNNLYKKSLEEWLYPKLARKKRVEEYRRKN